MIENESKFTMKSGAKLRNATKSAKCDHQENRLNHIHLVVMYAQQEKLYV